MSKKLILTALTIILVSSAAAESQLTLEITDRQGNTVPATFQVENSSGVVAEEQDVLQVNLTTDSRYTVTQIIENEGTNVTLQDLNMTQDFSPDIRYTGNAEDTPYLENREDIYAFDDTSMDYNSATINYTRETAPDNILHCTDYSFSTTDCNNWNINSSTDYDISQQNSIFSYTVNDFSAYTAGDTAPRLNITNIRIFNVTDLTSTEQKYDGTLIDQGLNKTFTTEQKNENADFRFTFSIENTGTENWDLASADTIQHTGIDTGWTVSEIWYNTSQEYTGGSFSSGEVNWNTDSGTLETESVMNASYVTSTDLQDTQIYDQEFYIADSSTNAGDNDQHALEAIKYGRIDVELITPPENTLLTQNKTFNMTANLTCSNGDCGIVDAEPRYNTTDGQTVLPGEGETPFALQESSVNSCQLSSGEECSTDWLVNATGQIDSYHELDVSASSSSYPEIPGNSSGLHLVEISIPIDFSLSWNTIDFGALNPGADDRAAEGNDNNQYNITVAEDSRQIDDLWVKGEDLVSTEDSSYSIGIGNVSYSLQNDISNENRLSNTYQHVKSNLDPGTILPTFYWLDVPFGMTEGGYNGTITFKANTTE